jgi:hypothetical protein
MRDLVRFLKFRSCFFGLAAVGAVLTALLILAGMPARVMGVFGLDRARVLDWLDRQKA